MPQTPTKPRANGAEMHLSQREIQIIAKAWLCIKSVDKNGVPKVDHHKLCKIGNYASADSARVCWAPIAKKLAIMAGNIDADPATATTPVIPSTGKTSGADRKRKVKAEDDEEVEVEETPSKKPRGRKRMKREVKKESEDEDEDFGDDEV
ncbi:hypothetical protein F4776DRAFT_635133 [Hypoxylon sp. NC0597]|nr:hypothetical protein F4776DRAFT_635133 [Hypoxylon sp. NC0597]